MYKRITIASYVSDAELAVAKGRLEAEGITCYVQDEYTTQVYNLTAYSIGGVKLQVAKEDAAKAIEILREYDLLPIEEPVNRELRVVDFLERITSKVPFLNTFSLGKRISYLFLSAILLFVIFFFVAQQKSDFELIYNTAWCVEEAVVGDEVWTPNTTEESQIIIYGECHEKAYFYRSGNFKLPGFGSPAIKGKWWMGDGVIEISELDTLGDVLNGRYTFDVSGSSLTLYSEHVELRMYR